MSKRELNILRHICHYCSQEKFSLHFLPGWQKQKVMQHYIPTDAIPTMHNYNSVRQHVLLMLGTVGQSCPSMRHDGCYPTGQYHFVNILKVHAFNVLIELFLLIFKVICLLLEFKPQFDDLIIELIGLGKRLNFDGSMKHLQNSYIYLLQGLTKE